MSEPPGAIGARRPRRRPTPPKRAAALGGRGPPPPLSARERFLALDGYRVAREWKRYEGTAQRELFRSLRVRFLRRHSLSEGWALEVGSGPGRFLPDLGPASVRKVALDLSREMLLEIPRHWRPTDGLEPLPERVVADGAAPPFRSGAFDQVVALGNAVGFSGREAETFLSTISDLVRPGGRLLLETVAGAGERSRYLARLPPGAARRLLGAPVAVAVPRVRLAGFDPEPGREKDEESFRRFGAAELHDLLRETDFEPVETLSVAPCLGARAATLEAVRGDARAWGHLLDLEEEVGRDPERGERAAAILLAARRRATSRGTAGGFVTDNSHK